MLLHHRRLRVLRLLWHDSVCSDYKDSQSRRRDNYAWRANQHHQLMAPNLPNAYSTECNSNMGSYNRRQLLDQYTRQADCRALRRTRRSYRGSNPNPQRRREKEVHGSQEINMACPSLLFASGSIRKHDQGPSRRVYVVRFRIG